MSIKPYYDKDGITLYCGDCLEVLPTLDADVLVSDPPYGIKYSTNRDATVARATGIAGDDDTSLRDAALLMHREKPALVFGTWKMPQPKGTRHVLTWEKGDHSGMGDLSLPWKPNTEEIYILGTGFHGHRGTSVLRTPAPVTWASRGRTHPHEKPVLLMQSLIAKCPNGVIVDPFCGTGATLIAANVLGRRAIGIEIEEEYCEIAVERLRQKFLNFG